VTNVTGNSQKRDMPPPFSSFKTYVVIAKFPITNQRQKAILVGSSWSLTRQTTLNKINN